MNISQGEISRETPIPLYYQVSQILRREIDTGKYSPGEYIPTEAELQQRFRVSRATVRQALSELVYEGLLERRRSKGTVVSTLQVEAWLKNLSSFTNEIMEQRLDLTTKILEFHQIPCPEAVGDHLELTRADLVYEMSRLRLVAEKPVAVEKWYASVKLFPTLNRSMFGETGYDQSTYFVLNREFNLRIARATDTVSAANLEARDARLLGLPGGSPVLVRTRESFSADGHPVTYATGVYSIKLKFALGETP